jgi:CheY-like chemotaxis protein
MLDGHELHCADNMAQAEEYLRREPFDLIICTIAFDETRMFDFLRVAKSKPEWERIPFIGVRVMPHVLFMPSALKAAAMTCRELGAEAFLNITDYESDPEREMRAAIESFLGATAS